MISPWMRIVKSPIQKYVEALGFPFISTSVNITGESPISSLYNMPKCIEEYVDTTIDEWCLSGAPSVLIDFVSGKIIHR